MVKTSPVAASFGMGDEWFEDAIELVLVYMCVWVNVFCFVYVELEVLCHLLVSINIGGEHA